MKILENEDVMCKKLIACLRKELETACKNLGKNQVLGNNSDRDSSSIDLLLVMMVKIIVKHQVWSNYKMFIARQYKDKGEEKHKTFFWDTSGNIDVLIELNEKKYYNLSIKTEDEQFIAKIDIFQLFSVELNTARKLPCLSTNGAKVIIILMCISE